MVDVPLQMSYRHKYECEHRRCWSRRSVCEIEILCVKVEIETLCVEINDYETVCGYRKKRKL